MSKHNRHLYTPQAQGQPLRPASPPPGAVWNGIRRLWMVDGEPVSPQPPAPRPAQADLAPAVKEDLG